jgi:two-component system response regulator RegX3
VELTPSEFRLLAILVQEPERAFARGELLRRLWRTDYVGDERACDSHVVNLRRKIERDPARPERIVTVRGHGYKLRAV